MAKNAVPDWKKIKEDISNGSIARFYLFYGEERYLLNFYKEELVKAVVGDSMPEFNLIEFTGKLDMNELYEAIDAYPVMSEKKMIIVSDFDIFKTDEETRDIFAKALADLPEYCCLLFVYPADFKPDKRLKLYTAMSKAGDVVEFLRADRSELISWISRRFKAQGKIISAQLCEYLVFYCGSLMQALIPEIEKICSYSKQSEITREAIDAVATPNVEVVVFDLTDAIVARQYKKAIEILEKLMLLGEEPIMLLALIGKQLRQIYSACLLQRQGGGLSEIMKICNMRSEYPARIVSDAARKVTLDWARNSILLCAETDSKLKLGAKQEALEELIARLAVYGEQQ